MMKGSIDILILALLYKQDMYGYQIAKSLKEESDNQYKMSEGTLYPALKRLEAKGLLQSYWQDADDGKRRKYYSLTEQGKESYTHKLEQWQKIHSLIMKVAQEGYA
nr:PadR family transcriptional regulator [Paenactinomyces guangxiensis]